MGIPLKHHQVRTVRLQIGWKLKIRYSHKLSIAFELAIVSAITPPLPCIMLRALFPMSLVASAVISSLDVFPVTYLEGHADVLRVYNSSKPLKSFKSSRISRGLVERQTCSQAGYSPCEGQPSCCPAGGTCCIGAKSGVDGQSTHNLHLGTSSRVA